MCANFIRKSNRMISYDYASNGMYFLTICSRNIQCLLADSHTLNVSKTGLIAQECIEQIDKLYQGVRVDKYVIMPNHIHLLLCLQKANATVSTIISQFKRSVSIRAGESIWQKSFYDHVIRGEADYQKIWQYIENNPDKWIEDRYYLP